MDVLKDKVEKKGIMEDDEAMAWQHLCLHTFLTWATHGAGASASSPGCHWGESSEIHKTWTSRGTGSGRGKPREVTTVIAEHFGLIWSDG